MKLHLDGATIDPSHVVRDLGVYFDSELTMREHISKITKSCFYQLRRIRPIHKQLGPVVTQRLVAAFVMSRIDYCNSVLAELPATTLATLQRVQNAAARLVLNLKRSDHITPALIQLHWLPVKFRIIYKLCSPQVSEWSGRSGAFISQWTVSTDFWIGFTRSTAICFHACTRKSITTTQFWQSCVLCRRSKTLERTSRTITFFNRCSSFQETIKNTSV